MKMIRQHAIVLTPMEEWCKLPQLVEHCGRVCYKSEDKITTDSSTKFISRILKNGHESVLEHGNLTVKFITDRGVTHRLVRHRHCAFSQESTHYLDYGDELTFIEREGEYLGREKNEDERRLSYIDRLTIEEAWRHIETLYATMPNTGQYYKNSILPQGIKTELVMTTNIREWRHILKIRTEDGCHPQTRMLMYQLLYWFKLRLPVFVSDINIAFPSTVVCALEDSRAC